MIANTVKSPVTLNAETAADLMVENPISVPEDASVRDALALFTKKGISVAPVINKAGRPIGVVSRSDVNVHDRTRLTKKIRAAAAVSGQEPGSKDIDSTKMADGDVGEVRVGSLMTPAVFSVAPSSSARSVIREMLALNVHHIFVVDHDGVLVGVISPLDILRRLR